MNTYDPQKAARVWQRVQNQAKAEERELSNPEGSIRGLIMEERISAAIYLQLSRQVPSREASVLQRLFREKQTHGACLRGIYTLITGEKPEVKLPAVASEKTDLMLRRCYAREMRMLKEYEARSSDPEYGPIFTRLAEQEREHCRAVLEVIGGLQKK